VYKRQNTYLEDARACFENGIKVRLCKGAYPSKIKNDDLMVRAEQVLDEYVMQLEIPLEGKVSKFNLLEIATMKDIDLVKLALKEKLPLQLLYGWHKEFIEYPYGVKIYTAFGNNWRPYIARRLREKVSK